MSSFKHQNRDANDLTSQSRGYDLWYYEQRGNGRLYFRLAPLGWALLVIPAMLAIVVMILLYLYNASTPIPRTDVTVKPPPDSPDTLSNLEIKPALSPPSKPRVKRAENLNSINPLSRPQSVRNINGQ